MTASARQSALWEELRSAIVEMRPPDARRPRLRAACWWLANRAGRFSGRRAARVEIGLHDLGLWLGGTR